MLFGTNGLAVPQAPPWSSHRSCGHFPKIAHYNLHLSGPFAHFDGFGVPTASINARPCSPSDTKADIRRHLNSAGQPHRPCNSLEFLAPLSCSRFSLHRDSAWGQKLLQLHFCRELGMLHCCSSFAFEPACMLILGLFVFTNIGSALLHFREVFFFSRLQAACTTQ